MSLIEVLVSVGILTFCIAIGALATTKDLSMGLTQSDRDTFEDALMLARTRSALSHTSHGVQVGDDSFTVFQDPVLYPDRRPFTMTLPHHKNVISSADTTFLFEKGLPGHSFSYFFNEDIVTEVSEKGRILSRQAP